MLGGDIPPSSYALAKCLDAWLRGDDSTEARAGGIVIADFVNEVRGVCRAMRARG